MGEETDKERQGREERKTTMMKRKASPMTDSRKLSMKEEEMKDIEGETEQKRRTEEKRRDGSNEMSSTRRK